MKNLKIFLSRFISTYNFAKGLKDDTEEEFNSEDPSTYLKPELFKNKNITELERLLDKILMFNSSAEDLIIWFKKNIKSLVNLSWEEFLIDSAH